MLDDKKSNNIDIVIIAFLVVFIVIVSISLVFVIMDMKEQSEFIDSLDDMSCSELLTEIKDEHPIRKGYGYLETWVEKECWKE